MEDPLRQQRPEADKRHKLSQYSAVLWSEKIAAGPITVSFYRTVSLCNKHALPTSVHVSSSSCEYLFLFFDSSNVGTV